MKSPPTFQFRSQRDVGRGLVAWQRRRGRGGFTLIEVLTSIAVMAILTAMLGTMILTMGHTWENARDRVNNFTKARAMLDMMDNDLQAGLFRPDLPAFPSGNMEFYTLRPGISTAQPVRNISAVGYQINTASNVLQRSDQSYQWTSAIAFGAGATFPTTGTARDTAPGVVGFQVVFEQADGTLSTNTYNSTSTANPTRAIGITLAVVDDQTMLALSAANQVTTLSAALKNAVPSPPTGSVKAVWESYLNGTSMNWKSYPSGLGVGLKIFERYVILPNTTYE